MTITHVLGLVIALSSLALGERVSFDTRSAWQEGAHPVGAVARQATGRVQPVGKNIDALRTSGYKTVAYLPEREPLVAHLVDICRRGDLVRVMGAGDIGEAAAERTAALADGERS